MSGAIPPLPQYIFTATNLPISDPEVPYGSVINKFVHVATVYMSPVN